MNKIKFFTKKKLIWLIIILIIIGGAWYYRNRPQNTNNNIQTIIVKRQDIKSTVLTTGQVLSKLNLNLSFQANGVVQTLKVVAGDKVKTGDILGTLNQASAQAALISAQGSLAQAQANYAKVARGATTEQINVSKKAVNSAQVAYNNSLAQLKNIKSSTAANISQAEITLNDLKSPTTQSQNKRSAIIVTIANQLTLIKSDLDQENRILADDDLKDTFSVLNINILNQFKVLNSEIPDLLDQANASLALAQNYKSDANIDQAINDAITVLNKNIIALNDCYKALQASIVSAKFSQSQLDNYKMAINTGSRAENSGISAINAARQILTTALINAQNNLTNTKLNATKSITSEQNQINSARAALEQAQAILAQQVAKAQPADIAIARAQILSAKGRVDAAQVNFDNTILKAPINGTVTSVDTKIGQQVNALQEVIVLQDMKSLHTEAYVSEANIASLKLGQTVDYTFDALGPDRHFKGKIFNINPASTLISGVVDYLVKASIPNIPEIKPGMTANMTIGVASKNQAIAIPGSAIIYQGNQQYVRIIDNSKTKTYHKVLVKTGLQADGGLIEITSGLKTGQEIVTYIKP